MRKAFVNPFSTPKRSIIRWFLACFLCFDLIFIITLIPLLSYSRNVFADLTIKRSTQQMDHGITQLENTVNSVNSASYNLINDIRFLPLFYKEPDYSSITVSVRNQMTNYLNGLMFPLSLVKDSALLFSENTVITKNQTMFNEAYLFYPDRFRVDERSYKEWISLLETNDIGFLPACHVVTTENEYDALIYSLSLPGNGYFYVCLDINHIKQAFIASSMLNSCRLTISDFDGNILYTDLSGSLDAYYSVTQSTKIGHLSVTAHIPHAFLTENMKPFYYFIGFYLLLCVTVLIAAIFVGSHFSSKPLLDIVHMLEGNDLAKQDGDNFSSCKKQKPPFRYGFHYIQERVQTYENNLNDYRNTIATQSKVLQARYLEKALQGFLITAKEYEQFFSYFPMFPKCYGLVQIGLIGLTETNGSVFPETLAVIQCYVEEKLPNTYLQKLNDEELLMIVDGANFDSYRQVLDLLIRKINREESSYHVWGIASDRYQHPKNLPFAFEQIQDLRSRIPLKNEPGLCIASELQLPQRSSFLFSDALSLHAAIACGNKSLALLKLNSISETQHITTRPVFELLHAILLCIKQDQMELLMNEDIPSYHPKQSLYDTLENAIGNFCDKIHAAKAPEEQDSFAEKVQNYIDIHFSDDDLSLTKIADYFSCSPSKIQKGFSKEVGMAVSNYIEKKRMELANQLLQEGSYSVSEVAQKCGFAHNNTFYKAYKRTFGYAPTSAK